MGELHGDHAVFAREAVEPGDEALIAPHPEFDPEYNQSGVKIPAAQLRDELHLLVRMMVKPPGAVTKGIPGAVATFFPTVDILTVGFELLSSLRNAIFLSIADEG